jgi:lysozyme
VRSATAEVIAVLNPQRWLQKPSQISPFFCKFDWFSPNSSPTLCAMTRLSVPALASLMCLWSCQRAAPPVPAAPEFVMGMDLSHHNGRIDWDRVETTEIGFVYFKATEGRSHKDPRFQENWQTAHARGYTVGAYHFFRLCVDGAAQADNFIQSVEMRRGALPPAIDLEYAENCEPKSDAAMAADLNTALLRLEQEYGAAPVIYTTPDFYADHLAGRYQANPIWIRGLGDTPPTLPDGRDWTIWQYDMRGAVAGINGDVDLNRMDESQLSALTASKSTTTPK